MCISIFIEFGGCNWYVCCISLDLNYLPCPVLCHCCPSVFALPCLKMTSSARWFRWMLPKVPSMFQHIKFVYLQFVPWISFAKVCGPRGSWALNLAKWRWDSSFRPDVHTWMYVYVLAYIYIYIYMCVHHCCMYLYVYIYVYIDIHIYICI